MAFYYLRDIQAHPAKRRRANESPAANKETQPNGKPEQSMPSSPTIRAITSTEPKEFSPLSLQLPPELRIKIYEYALVSDQPITTVFSMIDALNITYAMCQRQAPAATTPRPLAAGLLATNKQLRYETLPIYYSRNVFSFNRRIETYTFLASLTAQKRALLTSVHFNFLPKMGSPPLPANNPEVGPEQHTANQKAAVQAEWELAVAGLGLPIGSFVINTWSMRAHELIRAKRMRAFRMGFGHPEVDGWPIDGIWKEQRSLVLLGY